MMKNRGHTVYLYAGTKNEAPCDELITCISEPLRRKAVGNKHYTQAEFGQDLPHWKVFNRRAIRAMKSRIQQKDLICIIGGHAHRPIVEAFPNHISVEFGVGYSGVFHKFKVFESYAWMHTVYGTFTKDANLLNGNWYDAVIPSYIEPEKFPYSETKDDYYLYMGRLIDRKGWQIAADVCKLLDKKLILAGPKDDDVEVGYGEYIGSVGPQKRGELMSKATAVFCPTIYIEPFGTVNVEAQACGTPVITTDWGAFTETVIQGVTGFRCRSFREFCQAATTVKQLKPNLIRKWAIDNYSLDAVALKYEQYFNRLLDLWDKGWYQT
jgi:glycosyltransferase involved in cell wall biosynthesis